MDFKISFVLGSASDVKLIGGTDVAYAPPFDFLSEVVRPVFLRLGLNFEVNLIKRGFFPKGKINSINKVN